MIIMEPLRGGKLVNLLPDSAKKLISEHESGYTAAEWAFRWLWEQPAVTCVLSGMNSMEMKEENCRIASKVEINSFSNGDFEFIEKIKNEINKNMKVGCTGCGYCMPCIKGVDIPTTFNSYNMMYTESKFSGRKEFLMRIGFRKEDNTPNVCIGCGKCEKHCPQHLPIRMHLKEAAKELHPWYMRIAMKIVRWVKVWK